MLSTIGSNFLKKVNYQNIIDRQNSIESRARQNSHSENAKLSEYSYFDRKMRLQISSEIKINQSYITNNNRNIQSFSVMQDSVEHIKENALKFKDVIEFYERNNPNIEDLIPSVKNIFNDVVQNLNQQWNEKYLFSGNDHQIKPVDEDFLNTDIDVMARDYNYSYYKGSNDDVELNIRKNIHISHEINAKNKNFAFLLNALNAFINKKIDGGNLDNFTRGLGVVIENLTGIQSSIDTINKTLNDSIEFITDENTIFSEIINKNDIMEQAEIFSELEQTSHILQESIEINKKIAHSRKMNEQ